MTRLANYLEEFYKCCVKRNLPLWSSQRRQSFEQTISSRKVWLFAESHHFCDSEKQWAVFYTSREFWKLIVAMRSEQEIRIYALEWLMIVLTLKLSQLSQVHCFHVSCLTSYQRFVTALSSGDIHGLQTIYFFFNVFCSCCCSPALVT